MKKEYCEVVLTKDGCPQKIKLFVGNFREDVSKKAEEYFCQQIAKICSWTEKETKEFIDDGFLERFIDDGIFEYQENGIYLTWPEVVEL